MKTKLVSGAFALALIATSCSSFDRAGAVEDLVDSGLTQAQAECTVDGIVEEFGEDKVNSNDDPTPEEIEILTEIAVGCIG